MTRALALIAAVCLVCAGGCAIAPRADGGYVLGVGMSGEPGTPSDIGNAIGKGLSILGVPAGPVIGTGIAGLLTAFGWGAHQRRKGENNGFDEGARTYAPPPPTGPRPGAGAAGAGAGGAGVAGDQAGAGA